MNSQLELNFGSFQLYRAGHREFDTSQSRWLIENVWFAGGTGMLGGPPKVGKTWLLIDMAVSIASGTPFLCRFNVQQGPVVIYSPEGPDRELDERIRQVAASRGLDHDALPIYVLDAKEFFLDSLTDQQTIIEMIKEVKPALTIFDPLVECFAGDENRTADVTIMTRFLVSLGKQYGASTLVAHHMVKSGDSMRGAGALLGFGDSYLFLEKTKSGKVIMKPVQKHGKPASPCALELVTTNDNTYYLVDGGGIQEEDEKPQLGNQILEFMKTQKEPLSQTAIRKQVGGDFHKYPAAMRILQQAEEIEKVGKQWQIRKPQEEAAQKPE